MSKPVTLDNPAQFGYEDESRATANIRWKAWVRDFEIFTAASGIPDEKQRVAIFLHVVGKSSWDIYYSKPATDSTKDADVKAVLTNHLRHLRIQLQNRSR